MLVNESFKILEKFLSRVKNNTSINHITKANVVFITKSLGSII